MKKRIGLFLCARPTDGGAFSYSQSMLEAVSTLPENRFEKSFCITDPRWLDSVREAGIPYVFWRSGAWRLLAAKRVSRYFPMQAWRTLSRLFHPCTKRLVEQNCDLWIFPSQDTWTYLIPVPSLGTIYDLMHRYEPRFPEVSAHGLFKTREKHYSNMCRWAEGILVDSEIGKTHVRESYHLHPSRIHVLPFVAPKHIAADAKPESFDVRYRLPRKFFFYPAQFWKHKNHKIIVQAMASLVHEIPDLHAVFVGSKKNGYESTHQMVHELQLLDHTHFLGYVSDQDMPEFYRRARALIMPTFFGPTNIPPLEAMALGCPAAVSRIYGMPEQLGHAALFFDPHSLVEVVEIMRRLWNDDDLCNDLSRLGLLRSAEWTQAHFNRRLEEIVTDVLSRPAKVFEVEAGYRGSGLR